MKRGTRMTLETPKSRVILRIQLNPVYAVEANVSKYTNTPEVLEDKGMKDTEPMEGPEHKIEIEAMGTTMGVSQHALAEYSKCQYKLEIKLTGEISENQDMERRV